MYVKVLYDHDAKRGLLSGHGFSCLIGGKILFDTGEKSHSLVDNMDRMMVSASDIEGIVISHDHWDHTGGLWELLKRKGGVKVYACESFSDTFKKCVKESGGDLVISNSFSEISENIFLTENYNFEYKDAFISEQAMVIKGDNGYSVITGCAHPGIVDMLTDIKEKFSIDSIYMVFGGFHMTDMKREEIEDVIRSFRMLGVSKVGPTHCSGEKARRIFRGRFNKNFVPVKAGHIIHL